MLKIKLVDAQMTLNNFTFHDVKEYIPGSALTLKVQISDSETNQRLIPATTAKMNAIFQLSDGSELTKAATMLFNPDDRSMWQIVLTAAQTLDIVGSNIKFELDFNGSATLPPVLSDSTDLRSGMAYSILSKITFDGEC
jgi:hypothetical protein